ncbi:MAG TPA: CPBP family intramembrane glutamic endopeptidase [Isosphaeraceae bacterium]|nr:CPBP family intramembrane glutamic endopeptidase [Isosphaeraceae bacterium]
MGMIIPEQFLLAIVVWLALALFSGMVLSWIWALRRLVARQPLLPERPLVERNPPPWGGGTVLLVFVTYVLGNVLAFWGYARATGVAATEQAARITMVPATEAQQSESGKTDQGATARPREGDRPGSKTPATGPTASAHSPGAETDVEKLSLTELMAVQTAISLVLLVLVPWLVRAASGARLRDFGLSFQGWDRQAAAGMVAVLITAPVVYGIQHVIVNLLHVRPRSHPVETMLRDQASGGVADLAILAAVIVAPLLEELLFRGIFQRWLIKLLSQLGAKWRAATQPRPARDLVRVLPVLPPDELDYRVSPLPEPVDPSQLGSGPAVEPESPTKNIEASAGPGAGIAIVLTSLFFAAVHIPQWPAPIPLFVLSLAIGTVYHRTGSLIAAVCMHAVFNGFSVLGLIIMLVGAPRSAVEKAIPPPALERGAPVERPKPMSPGDRPVAGLRKTGITTRFLLDETRAGCYSSRVVRKIPGGPRPNISQTNLLSLASDGPDERQKRVPVILCWSGVR